MVCVLCLNKDVKHYYKDGVRDYWQCQTCQLIFVKPNHFLSTEQEKFIYDQHENNPEDLGYVKFLNKLLVPMVKKLPSNSKGLDFGSGPGPTISMILNKQGFHVENFDVFYANNPKLLENKYDFITCTEVIEHLHNPHKEITLLKNLLNKNGYLGIMTKRVFDKVSFKTWHYKNDPTHVCFYSDATFKYIAKHWNFSLELIGTDTLILKK